MSYQLNKSQAIAVIKALKAFAAKDHVIGVYDAQEMIDILDAYEDEVVTLLTTKELK